MEHRLGPWWSVTWKDKPMLEDEVIGLWHTENYPDIAICMRVDDDQFIAFDEMICEWTGCDKPDFWQPYLLSSSMVQEVLDGMSET